jgi:hypothetical protein
MASSRVRKTSSVPSKVRKLKKGGDHSRVENDSPSITASVNRRQGLGGGKLVPSVLLGAKYKFNFK